MRQRTVIFYFLTCLFFQIPVQYSWGLEAKGPAFGKPGITPNWSSAKKVQAMTSYEAGEARSPVYFTMAHGALTEVYFPTVDKGQIKDSQLLVSDGKGMLLEERKNFENKVNILSPSLVELVNENKDLGLSISHIFYTMPKSAILVDKVTIKSQRDGLEYFLLSNPHIDNTGYRDRAYVYEEGFKIQDGATILYIESTVGFKKRSVGFVGKSDGYQDLMQDFQMDYEFDSAEGGNVATMGQINIPPVRGEYTFYVLYRFNTGSSRNHIDAIPGTNELEAGLAEFETGWRNYLSQVKRPHFRHSMEELLYLRSLVTLKAHEDKLNPGALVASLSVPWGEKQYESDENKIGGYHLIWPRDLYHVALSLLLSGDMKTPLNALRYLARVQYRSQSGNWNYTPRIIPKEGAWPQNTWVNGEEYWSGLQIDQVGYPVHLFFHIYRQHSEEGKAKLLREFDGMLTNALNFIKNYGPWTAQERWEENFGISPSSFSVATSALLIGAEIYKGTQLGTEYFHTAMGWLHKPGDNIDTWTFTQNGVLDQGRYYLRIGGCQSYDATWNPDATGSCHLANSSRRYAPSEFLDQGFMKLALLGLKKANDEKILTSVDMINRHIRVKTPNGYGWYRYRFDAYGEEGQGRLWPLLSGEHGRFQLELYKQGVLTKDETLSKVDQVLDSYLGFANDGLMIPEQVFEFDGEGTGAATPLAWSHAEFIKLLWSKHHMKNLANPLN